MISQQIKIRYNTEKDKSDPNLPAWRVLIEGVEHLAETVEIASRCWTTQDEISPGLIKWHITCSGLAKWNGRKCIINGDAHVATAPRAGVIWLTGLPAAGKTTVAKVLAQKMRNCGCNVEELDGDVIREFFPSTGYSKTDRDEHIRRVGFMASRLEAQRVVVIASLVSPYIDSRAFVKKICKNYFEVYVSTPLDECERRDPKGLYKKARAGLIQGMTGIDGAYEVPLSPQFSVDTRNLNPDQAADEIFKIYVGM